MGIYFDQKPPIPLQADTTVLAQALAHGLDVAHICKGHARCSTCRVVVLDGSLPPRNEQEQRLADKLGFPEHVRLSCQLKADRPMKLRRVIRDQVDHQLLAQSNNATERLVAILFSDIRSFTSFSERHLSYDIVHILNRYFTCMGDAILANHGQIDKYIGDGLMAIFGLNSDEHPARLAYKAALEMQHKLVDFNHYLFEAYGERFEIGSEGPQMSIHYGEAVLGNLGHPQRASYTAIGDAVNIASRIESATKGISPLLVSEQVYSELGALGWQSIEIDLKGKSEALRLYGPRVNIQKD